MESVTDFVRLVMAKVDARVQPAPDDDIITRDELRQYIALALEEYHAAVTDNAD